LICTTVGRPAYYSAFIRQGASAMSCWTYHAFVCLLPSNVVGRGGLFVMCSECNRLAYLLARCPFYVFSAAIALQTQEGRMRERIAAGGNAIFQHSLPAGCMHFPPPLQSISQSYPFRDWDWDTGLQSICSIISVLWDSHKCCCCLQRFDVFRTSSFRTFASALYTRGA